MILGKRGKGKDEILTYRRKIYYLLFCGAVDEGKKKKGRGGREGVLERKGREKRWGGGGRLTDRLLLYFPCR